MPDGTDYNLLAYARAIGSKALREMGFLNTIQPTVQVADFTALSPAHQPPSSSFGFNHAAVAGERARFEVACRGPGGCFVVDAISISSLGVFTRFAVRSVSAGLGTTLDPQTFANEATKTTVTTAQDADPQILATANFPILTTAVGFPFGAWLPPGSFLLFEQVGLNITSTFSITIVDVPVGEGGDGLPS